MFKIGLSTATNITEELFASYKRAGIECMEVSRGKEETDVFDYGKIKEWSEKYGIELYSFHLPFMPFGVLDISNPNLAESTIEYLKDIIDKACAIGIDKFIIHASGEPIDENDRTKRMECAKNSLNILATYTKERGAVLCVEDLPRTCLGRDSSDILELISANENLRVCFDTNHLLEEENIDFIRKVGDKIITLHVSDYDRVNERHWLPGEGINDWQQIISELNKIGYSGAWLYEIDYQTGTIIRDRAIVDEDFVRNANELFENKPLTLFSKQKPNLGYWN